MGNLSIFIGIHGILMTIWADTRNPNVLLWVHVNGYNDGSMFHNLS